MHGYNKKKKKLFLRKTVVIFEFYEQKYIEKIFLKLNLAQSIKKESFGIFSKEHYATALCLAAHLAHRQPPLNASVCPNFLDQFDREGREVGCSPDIGWPILVAFILRTKCGSCSKIRAINSKVR